MKTVTNLPLSIKLKELGICKPSYWYYEWTGAKEVERATGWGYFVDNINAYTAVSLKRLIPSSVAINENVIEIGYRPEDNEADKLARLLIYMIERNLIIMDKRFMIQSYTIETTSYYALLDLIV